MVVILHAAVIALALLSRTRAPAGQTAGLAAFDLAANNDPAPKSHPVRPHRAIALSPSNPIPAPVIDMASVELVQPAATAPPAVDIAPVSFAAGAGCDLTQPAQDALRRSVALNRDLPDIPADRRSIANAIVVWNAGWIDPGLAPARSAFAAIRQTITQTVLAAPVACRNQLQAGPRLIYLPGTAGKTTVLALGSGSWTWQQVADGVPPSRLANEPAQLAAVYSAPPVASLPFPARPATVRPSQTPDVDALLASLIRNRSVASLPYYP